MTFSNLDLQALALGHVEPDDNDELAEQLINVVHDKKGGLEQNLYARLILFKLPSSFGIQALLKGDIDRSLPAYPLPSLTIERYTCFAKYEEVFYQIDQILRPGIDICFFSYFQDALIAGVTKLSCHLDLLKKAIDASEYSALCALRCLNMGDEPSAIIEIIEYAETNHPDLTPFSLFADAVEVLGTLAGHHEKIAPFLERVSRFPELGVRLKKAKDRQRKLLEQGRESYKNPNLKYAPYTRPISLVELEKEIGWCRWQDQSNSFSEEDIREARNLVREELGLRRIGEGWSSELLLLTILRNMLEPYKVEVVHHFRPRWLTPQELDIYFEYGNVKVGIEYQGKQHYEPVSIFGGVEGYERTKIRDRKKADLCKQNDVVLIRYKYTTPINEANVKQALSEVVPSLV